MKYSLEQSKNSGLYILKMNNFLKKEKDSLFSFILSLFLHIFIISFIIIPYSSLIKAFANENEKNIYEDDNTVFLVETPDVPEEENNEKSKFVSDKELLQRGDNTKKPSILLTDDSIFSFLRDKNSQSQIQKQAPKNNPNEINRENSNDGDISSSQIETYKPQNPDVQSDTKIPSSFDEGADRAIVYSSETGQIQLGTKSQEYFWYFYALVNSIKNSWYRSIPNEAHYLGLLRTDNVEILLSIDESGNIAFEKFLKKSDKGQSSLDSSCSKAIEYAGKLNPPPQGLLRDYAENGKIYIPFKFIYQNFNDR